MARVAPDFGEILMTVGFYCLSLPCLSGWSHLAILSPLFTAFLLLRVSGVPMTERLWQKRYGSDPAFQEYLATTPVLVPWLY
jgi:steroid 5-alpha reductase family enzyme